MQGERRRESDILAGAPFQPPKVCAPGEIDATMMETYPALLCLLDPLTTSVGQSQRLHLNSGSLKLFPSGHRFLHWHQLILDGVLCIFSRLD